MEQTLSVGGVTLKYILYKLCEHGTRTIGEFETRQAALKKQNELLGQQEFSECFISISEVEEELHD